MGFCECHGCGATRQELQDAGFDAAGIEEFLRLQQLGCIQECINLLKVQRCRRMCLVHEAQKPLTALDYLLYKLKKEQCGAVSATAETAASAAAETAPAGECGTEAEKCCGENTADAPNG